ncbi:MAG: sigma 54-interacting transcriptional regulator [Sporomusaceae bacterium]|nr:sigma 54-interacting transcriptional regulator [Sporomusaceae bacterium]
MKIRQIMDHFFTICSSSDTISAIAERMTISKVSFVIVVDHRNMYKGVIRASSLLVSNWQEHSLGDFLQEIPPLVESDHITSLKKVVLDIVPVINEERNVVGVISFRSLVDYLPEVMAGCEERNLSIVRKDKQHKSKYTIDDIIGKSHTILSLKERIIAAAKTKSNVLILGETGTGKELVAHAIHRLNSRRHQAFVRVNCAAIPDNLLESELFGYEQGAFTGAGKGGHPGKFQMADGGTIFLDEIGDMPLSLQSKILRVLQEREIEKVGGHFPVPIDVRVIAATHHDLHQLIKEDKFRQDLFFRLHVIPIHMPALRTHPEDIPLLVELFLEKTADELGIEKPKVEHDFMKALFEYHWPGNVRELANIIEAAVSLSANGIITCEYIPDYIYAARIPNTGEALRAQADEAERDAILKASKTYKGDKLKIAEALGISRSSLYNKMKKFNIDI